MMIRSEAIIVALKTLKSHFFGLFFLLTGFSYYIKKKNPFLFLLSDPPHTSMIPLDITPEKRTRIQVVTRGVSSRLLGESSSIPLENHPVFSMATPTPTPPGPQVLQSEGGFSVENTLNVDENKPPFGLFNPETEGKLTWICGYGPDEKTIISMYCMDMGGGRNERQVSQLESLEQALYVRRELLANGWKLLRPPKVEFKVTNKDGMKVNPNRKQRRYLERKARQFAKQQAGIGNMGGTGGSTGDTEGGDEEGSGSE